MEHKRQKIKPFIQFLSRLLGYTLITLVMIVISLIFGTLGYKYWGELDWIDSFYMSSMILTGMGPIAIMKTNAAKLFSSIYALYSGVAFLSVTAVFFVPIIHRILHILHIEDKINSEE